MRDRSLSSANVDVADDGISYRGVAIAAGAIVLAIVIALASALVLLHVARTTPQAPTSIEPGPVAGPVSGPRLQPTPQRDIRAFREEKERALASYGWVDHDRGLMRIPITRAMEMLIERSGSGGAR